jgi:WD40 repeat protein/uncharacterized caspase-like protein
VLGAAVVAGLIGYALRSRTDKVDTAVAKNADPTDRQPPNKVRGLRSDKRFATGAKNSAPSNESTKATALAVHAPTDESITSGSEQSSRKHVVVKSNRDSASPELALQTGHTDEVTSVAFSPDGKFVVTGSRDKTAILWETTTGHKLRAFGGYAHPVYSVAFSSDSKRVLASSSDGAAMMWDAQSGKKLLSFPPRPKAPHASQQFWDIRAPVAFTVDPDKVLIGGTLWHARSGEKLDTLDQSNVRSLAFNSDGSRLLIGRDSNHGLEPVATLWDARSWRLLRAFKYEDAPGGYYQCEAAISPDGKQVFSFSGPGIADIANEQNLSSLSNTALLWAVDSRQVRQRFQTSWLSAIKTPRAQPSGHGGAITAVAFFPDGRKLLTGAVDQTAVIWDAAVEGKLRTLAGHTAWITSVAVSADGQHVVTGSGDQTAILWDAASGRKLRTFRTNTGRIRSLAVSPDGRSLVTGADDTTAVLWDGLLGQKVRTFHGHKAPVLSVAFNPAGTRILTNSRDATAVVWDAGTGQRLHTLQRITNLHTRGEYVNTRSRAKVGFMASYPLLCHVWSAFTPDGTQVYALPGDAFEWDVRTGERIARRLESAYPAVTLSADAKQIVIFGDEKNSGCRVEIWDNNTGERRVRFDDSRSANGIDHMQCDLALFSPDGKFLLMSNRKIGLWDTATGRKVRTFDGPNARYSSAAFSLDGRQLLTAYDEPGFVDNGPADWTKVLPRSDAAVLWDVTTGRLLRRFEGHSDGVEAVAFTHDGRCVLTGSRDGTTRIWNAATGEELARLISVNDGADWAVVTPEGLFDGSKQGREQVFYRIGNANELVPLDRFFQDFYYPGLLTEIWRGERPMPGKPLQFSPAPLVKILVNQESAGEQKNQIAIDVALTDQGGGIKGPWLQHNGVTLSSGRLLKKEAKSQQYRFAVALLPGDNRIEVRAATADGSVESEPAATTVKFDGKLPEPDLYVIAIGINRFAKGAGIADLEFCVPDAQAIADLFRTRPDKRYARVQVTALCDDQATRANILKAVTDLSAKARPQDTLVLYVASHGFTIGQRFYIFPHDFRLTQEPPPPPAMPRPETAMVALRGYRGTAEQDSATREYGLAIDELGEVLATVPALKRVLIFDTCHSGSAIALAGKQQNPFAFRGALERFSRAQGVYSLSATAADELAAETQELGHSILTYALLAGMKAVAAGPLADQALKGDKEGIDVLEWFRYAKERVPALYAKYAGRPQHVEISGDDQPGFAILALSNSQQKDRKQPLPEKVALPVPSQVLKTGSAPSSQDIRAEPPVQHSKPEPAPRPPSPREATSEIASQDTAVLELQLPMAAKVSIDGGAYSDERRYVFRSVKPKRLYRHEMTIRLADGKEMKRILLIRAGDLIRLPLLDPQGETPEMVLQTGHTDVVTSVSFSPEGKMALTGSYDGTAILWDAATGHKLRSFRGHVGSILAVAFSPNGRQILTGSSDFTAILWDTNGQQLARFGGTPGHTPRGGVPDRGIRAVAFSPDGQQIITGGDNRNIIIWDAKSGQKILALPPADVTSIAFSPKGNSFLIGLETHTAVLYDYPSGKELRRFDLSSFSPDANTIVSSVIFSPDSRLILVGGGVSRSAANPSLTKFREGAVLWETETGKQVCAFEIHRPEKLTYAAGYAKRGKLFARDHGISSLGFSADAQRVVTGLRDKTAIIWDTTGVPLFTLRGHAGPINSVAFSPDGRKVLTGANDRTAVIWDAHSGEILHQLGKTNSAVFGTAINSNGTQFLSGSGDGTVSLWDPRLGKRIRTLSGHTLPVRSLAFSRDGQKVITGGDDSTAAIWETESGKKLNYFQVLPGGYFNEKTEDIAHEVATGISYLGGYYVPYPTLVAFSPDGKQCLATYSVAGGGPAFLLDVSSGTKLRTFPTATKSGAAAFTPDGTHVLFGGQLKTQMWATTGGHKPSLSETVEDRISHRLRGANAGERAEKWLETGNATSMAFSSNGKQLLIGSGPSSLWDVKTWTKLREFRDACYSHTCAAFSPDDNLVAIATDAMRVDESLLDPKPLPARTERGRSNRGRPVVSLPAPKPAPKTARLPVTDAARIWDAESGELLTSFDGHNNVVNSLVFRPDSKLLLTGSSDGTTRIWDVATGDELARLLSVNGGKDWAVVTPQGLFDGSKDGREQVFYRMGNSNQIVPLDRFFQDFYYPGLLADIWRGERPMPGKSLQISPAPLVKILVKQESAREQKNQIAIDVALTDQGGGVKGPWLQHNGVTLSSGRSLKKEAKTQQYRFAVSLLPGDNRMEVRAATADGSVESEPAATTVKFDGKLPEPDLYVIAIGINRFAKGAGIADLEFCVPDAKAIADLFRSRPDKRYAGVHVTPLYDDQASRANILKAVTDLSAKAKPQDTLVLYVASHGFTIGQRFYIFPHDFRLTQEPPPPPAMPRPETTMVALRGYRGTAEQDAATREYGLAIDELGEVLATVPALKRVLIFDTCHSGSAIALAGKQQNPFAFRGALERFSRAQGVYSLSATAADELAAETQELGHSILTYALLAGMKAVSAGPLADQPLKGDKEGIDVLEWFRYAKERVPALYAKYAGRPQHVEMSGDDQPGFAILSGQGK